MIILIVCVIGIVWAILCSFIPQMNRMYLYPIIVGINRSGASIFSPFDLLILIVVSEVVGNQLDIYQYIQPITNIQNYEVGDEAAAFYIKRRKTRYLLKHLGFQFFISCFFGLVISIAALLIYGDLKTIPWNSQYISVAIYVIVWGVFIWKENNPGHCLIYCLFNILFSYLFITRFEHIDTNSLMMSFGFLLFSLNINKGKKKPADIISKDSRNLDGHLIEESDGNVRFISYFLSMISQYLVGIQSSVIIYQFKNTVSHIDYLSMLAISKGVACSLGLTYSLMQLMSKDAAANYLSLLLKDMRIDQVANTNLYISLILSILIVSIISFNIYHLCIEHYIQLQNWMSQSIWQYIPYLILGINLVITTIYIGNILTILPLLAAFYFLNLYRQKRQVNSLFSLTGLGILPLLTLMNLL